MTKEKVNEFIKELSKLSKKYNIYISGCGCCGSPTLESYMEDKYEDIGDNLCYNYDDDKYYVSLNSKYK